LVMERDCRVDDELPLHHAPSLENQNSFPSMKNSLRRAGSLSKGSASTDRT
jgi:hypothetical protein